jgi:hypothetical protein
LAPERPEREIGLRREHEHEQSRAQVELAVHQSQADRNRDERHRDGRHELEDQRRQEGDSQHRDRGFAVAFGDLADRCGLGLGAPEHLQRRQPGHNV